MVVFSIDTRRRIMAESGAVVDELLIIDKGTNAAEVQREIEGIVAELKKRDLAEVEGIQEGDYSASQGRGVGVIEVIVITFLGTLAKEAATTTWREIIWPSLQLRLKGKVKTKG
jgi:hypothetical protein